MLPFKGEEFVVQGSQLSFVWSEFVRCIHCTLYLAIVLHVLLVVLVIEWLKFFASNHLHPVEHIHCWSARGDICDVHGRSARKQDTFHLKLQGRKKIQAEDFSEWIIWTPLRCFSVYSFGSNKFCGKTVVDEVFLFFVFFFTVCRINRKLGNANRIELVTLGSGDQEKYVIANVLCNRL